MSERWYVDSSVVLRIAKEGSPAARAWFDAALARGDSFVASRLMRVEVLRVLRNNGLETAAAEDVIDRFTLLSLDDALADEAAALPVIAGGADALHLSAAGRLGAGAVTIVTHDAQMARAGVTLGYAVIDPVTDDPRHPAVV